MHLYALYFAVLMLHEQAAPAVTSMPSTLIARRSPTSVLLQEQLDENGLLLHMFKEDTAPQVGSCYLYILQINWVHRQFMHPIYDCQLIFNFMN